MGIPKTPDRYNNGTPIKVKAFPNTPERKDQVKRCLFKRKQSKSNKKNEFLLFDIITKQIKNRNGLCIKELREMLDIPYYIISPILKELERFGVIELHKGRDRRKTIIEFIKWSKLDIVARLKKLSKGMCCIIKYLKKHNIEYILEYRFNDCVNKRTLPFDIKIGNIIFEYDGEQHFKSIKHWGGDKAFEIRQKCDEIKNRYICNKKYFILVRISYKHHDYDSISKIIEYILKNKENLNPNIVHTCCKNCYKN